MSQPLNHRRYSLADRLLMNVDLLLRETSTQKKVATRPNPAESAVDIELNANERDKARRLMRINHTGEVCAQALYVGQSMAARRDDVREKLLESAEEEIDHLDWCQQRITELGGQTSKLNPLFYAGSFGLGFIAGIAGDKWSLGFIAETEYQVSDHIQDHLQQLPETDQKSRAILKQMEDDELQHATKALDAGGAELPTPIKKLMKASSKIMTKSVYWI